MVGTNKFGLALLTALVLGLPSSPEAWAGQLHFNSTAARVESGGTHATVLAFQVKKAEPVRNGLFSTSSPRQRIVGAALEVPMGREVRAALSLEVPEPGSLPLGVMVMFCAALAAAISVVSKK